MALDAITSAVP
jgi:hypothetical protein